MTWCRKPACVPSVFSTVSGATSRAHGCWQSCATPGSPPGASGISLARATARATMTRTTMARPCPAGRDGHGDGPEQWLLRAEEVRLLHLALEQLPLAFREVLVLRELEDLPYRDIAHHRGYPLGTVMSRLARCAQAAGGGGDRPARAGNANRQRQH
ncbi:sigma factor-like helix-turn-helix DNA-binding protein [Cupriavidus basilensis]